MYILFFTGCDFNLEKNKTQEKQIININIITTFESWALGILMLLSHLVDLLRCQRGSLDGVVA